MKMDWESMQPWSAFHPEDMSARFRALLVTGAFGQLTDEELLDRFIERSDAEAAFETLVLRHGPAVMQACRRILGDSHDAEDAFQATFLVLARRQPRSVGRSALGGWLGGVARRIARKARVANARRRRTSSGSLNGHRRSPPGGGRLCCASTRD